MLNIRFPIGSSTEPKRVEPDFDDLINNLKSLKGRGLFLDNNFHLISGIFNYFHLKPLRNKPDSSYLDLESGNIGNIIDWFEGKKYADEKLVIETFTVLNTYICSCDSDFDEDTKIVAHYFGLVYNQYFERLKGKYGDGTRKRIEEVLGYNKSFIY